MIFLNKYKKKKYNDYLILAEDGDSDYQIIVASILFDEANNIEGMKWLKKAAKQNNAQAQYLYGWHCLENNDLQHGKYYLSKASAQNYTEALYDEAKLSDFGDFGYEKDIIKATSLYKKACIYGNKKACNALYSILIETKGKEQAKQYIKHEIGCLKFLLIKILPLHWLREA